MQRITSSDSLFHDGDPSTGVLGTFLAAAWHNAVQEEIAGFIEGAGIVLDPTSDTQLVKAFMARLVGAVPLADTGAVNAYAAANIVPFGATTLVHGVRQRITIATTNTGASTYSPDGLPAKPIIGLNLSALSGLEMLAGQVAELEYIVAAAVNGGNGAWLLVRCGGGESQIAAATKGAHAAQAQQIQQNAFNYASAAGGTANALTATLAPVPAALTDDLVVVVRVASTNTGATTLNLNGLGAKSIVGAAHQALQGNELVANGFACFGYNTALASFVLLWATGGSEQVGAGTQSSHAVNLGQFPASFVSSGYQKLPSGLIIQWGSVTTVSGGNATWTLPLSFPNNMLFGSAILVGSGMYAVTNVSYNKSSPVWNCSNSGGGVSGVVLNTIAIGY